MLDLILKILYMTLGAIISGFIFSKLDKKYNLVTKLNIKLKLKKEWQPFIYTSMGLLVLFVIGILCMNVIKLPDAVYYFLCGIILGISLYMSNKTSLSKAKRR